CTRWPATASARLRGWSARTVSMSIDGESVRVEGDPIRLDQVISNLLDNAIKYTPAGGRVAVLVQREGAEAVLRDRDAGRGMRDELRARVFDLFVQETQGLDRSSGGLGVGLPLVK